MNSPALRIAATFEPFTPAAALLKRSRLCAVAVSRALAASVAASLVAATGNCAGSLLAAVATRCSAQEMGLPKFSSS